MRVVANNLKTSVKIGIFMNNFENILTIFLNVF